MIVGSNFDRSLIHKIFKRSIHFLDWAFFIWGHPVPEMRRKKAPHFGTGLRHPLYPVVLRKAKNGMSLLPLVFSPAGRRALAPVARRDEKSM